MGDRFATAEELNGPQFEQVLQLHRHKDGYISFAVKSDDDFRPVEAVLTTELEARFPAIQGRLSKDSYVSLNASFRLAKHGPDGKAYGHPKHATSSLRYLCACYADLDLEGRSKTLSIKDTGSTIIANMYQGVIPPASAIIFSGRGIWILWFLRDAEDPTTAQCAFPEKIDLYNRIQRAIVEHRVLADIGADVQAKDAARYIRVPGSFNTKAEDYVRWFMFRDENGGARTCTFAELATSFGVVDKPRRTSSDSNRTTNPNKRRGWTALNQRRLRDFENLRSLRGGFSEGCRNHVAFVYAWLLRCNGVSPDVATQKITELAAECRPPLSKQECKGAIRGAYKPGMARMADATIKSWLQITPLEADWLNEMRASKAPQHKAHREMPIKRAEARRQTILATIKDLGVLSCRNMAKALQDRGFRVAHSQVAKDYQVLGINTAPKRRQS